MNHFYVYKSNFVISRSSKVDCSYLTGSLYVTLRKIHTVVGNLGWKYLLTHNNHAFSRSALILFSEEWFTIHRFLRLFDMIEVTGI